MPEYACYVLNVDLAVAGYVTDLELIVTQRVDLADIAQDSRAVLYVGFAVAGDVAGYSHAFRLRLYQYINAEVVGGEYHVPVLVLSVHVCHCTVSLFAVYLSVLVCAGYLDGDDVLGLNGLAVLSQRAVIGGQYIKVTRQLGADIGGDILDRQSCIFGNVKDNTCRFINLRFQRDKGKLVIFSVLLSLAARIAVDGESRCSTISLSASRNDTKR